MSVKHWIAWSAALLLCLGVALVSYRYLLGVGPVPPLIQANLFRNPFLVIHIAGAATALLVGALQFLPRLRTRFAPIHRWNGRLYVLGCLTGGVAGFVLAFGASTGPVSTAGFGILAVIWVATTVLAWRAAMRRRFDEHRAWMVRSFALTFAAVTLRLYLPLAGLTSLPFDDAYRAIAFLCWVPNLLIAEIYLRATQSSPRIATRPA